MSAKIISANRYKKTTRKKAQQAKKNPYSTSAKKSNDLKYNKKKLKEIKDAKKIKSSKTVKQASKIEEDNQKYVKKAKKNNVYIPTIFKVGAAILVLIGIGFASKAIVTKQNLPKDTTVSTNENQVVALAPDYDLKVGVSKLDTTDAVKSKNIVLNELALKSKNQLLTINKDYTFQYVIASKIEKVSNKEYLVDLKPEYGISVSDIDTSIQKIKQAGPEDIYYTKVNNIAKVEEINGQIQILLTQEDPYFMYALTFPIQKAGESKTEYTLEQTTNTQVTWKRNQSKSTLNTITLSNFTDPDEMVANFRNGNLDVFFASSDGIMQLIGKHDYNIKKYRDGQTTFLLGNKNSAMFGKKEVRQAIAYSLNRDEIVKKVNNTFSEVIDLPFIYSNIRYKYDIYGANNVLLSNGWKKQGGMYKKTINNQAIGLSLNLLVNEADKTKVEIAELLKAMVENVGIRMNIVKANEAVVNAKVQSGDYDMVLADVYVNQIPDITFLEKYVDVNDTVHQAIEQVKNSDADNLPKNIQNLQTVMSEEVACIGIMAKDTNVVYQKYIAGFSDIGYMKVFSDLNSIGKISDIQNNISK